MDKNAGAITMKMLERTKEALEKNRINAYIAKDSQAACRIAQSLMHEGATVSCGGSMTLEECKMMDILRSGAYNFLDRSTTDDVDKLYRECFSADFYLCSSNAVTESGELYNVDGNSNRVACICYGPRKVIMIVGRNKIVRDLAEAQRRVKEIAAPANCLRLSKKTPCAASGKCIGENMCEGCLSEDRICANYVVSAYQRYPGRINVILVDEVLGY